MPVSSLSDFGCGQGIEAIELETRSIVCARSEGCKGLLRAPGGLALDDREPSVTTCDSQIHFLSAHAAYRYTYTPKTRRYCSIQKPSLSSCSAGQESAREEAVFFSIVRANCN